MNFQWFLYRLLKYLQFITVFFSLFYVRLQPAAIISLSRYYSVFLSLSVHLSISLGYTCSAFQFIITALSRASQPACSYVCVLVYVCNLGLGLPVWCSLFVREGKKERARGSLMEARYCLCVLQCFQSTAHFNVLRERVYVCAYSYVCIRLKSSQLLSLHGQANAVGTMSACVNVPFHLMPVTTERCNPEEMQKYRAKRKIRDRNWRGSTWLREMDGLKNLKCMCHSFRCNMRWSVPLACCQGGDARISKFMFSCVGYV